MFRTFKWLANFLGARTICIRVREQTWTESKLLGNLDLFSKQVRGYLKYVEGGNQQYIPQLKTALENKIQVIHDLLHIATYEVLLNCANYYDFWKKIKRLYREEAELVRAARIPKPRIKGEVKPEEHGNVLAQKIKELRELNTLKKIIVKECRIDKIEEEIILQQGFSFRNINFTKSHRLNEQVRIKIDKVKDKVDEIENLFKQKERTENIVRELEKKLKDAIEKTHKDLEFAQKFCEKIEKKKQEAEGEISNLRKQLGAVPQSVNLVIKPLEEKNAMLEGDLIEYMRTVYENFLVELNMISKEKLS